MCDKVCSRSRRSRHDAEPVALAIVVAGIAYVSLIIGELVPKRIAMINPERISVAIAGPMSVLARVSRPAVYVLSVSTDAVLKLLHVRHVKRAAVTVEEIKVLLEQSTTCPTGLDVRPACRGGQSRPD